jgi:hypothetical protein
MKAISLWQPFSSLISAGVKPHETRSWATSWRGELAIHAAKKWDRELRLHLDRCNAVLRQAGRPELPETLPLGAVVALATLRACGPTTFMGEPTARDALDLAFGDWSEGRFAWELADIRPLPEPIAWAGSQGLWDVPAELERRIHEAMRETEVRS